MESIVTGREDDESEPVMSEKKRDEETGIGSEARGERRRMLLWWGRGRGRGRRVWSMRFLAWPITNLRICVVGFYIILAAQSYEISGFCLEHETSQFLFRLFPFHTDFDNFLRTPIWNLWNFAFIFYGFFIKKSVSPNIYLFIFFLLFLFLVLLRSNILISSLMRSESWIQTKPCV